MGKDRLKRLLIVFLVIGLLLIGGKVFADWQTKKKASGESISLPTQQIGEKINDLGEQVLGKAMEIIPNSGGLKEKLKTEDASKSNTSQSNTEMETVVKTEQVETKTQEIIKIIKELPVEQLEKIKKQIFKDFCQKVLEEQ